ncbi:hypothetical protein BD626DRAFT_519755, partial [Schizophyllum amplum]
MSAPADPLFPTFLPVSSCFTQSSIPYTQQPTPPSMLDTHATQTGSNEFTI